MSVVTPPTAQIFLSYSRTNLEAALALRTELEKAGFTVFRDEDSIRVGDNWMAQLQTALQSCSAFVLLVGANGIQRWVMAETQFALARHLSPHDDGQRLPIFPILLPEGNVHSLPPFLSLFQIQRWQADQALPETLIHAIRDKTELLDNSNTVEGCPFLGLGAFQPEHAHLFFGRRKETLEALKFLGTQRDSNPANIPIDTQYCRWLQIEGNSGAGKSSLVNAGMLPLIQQGALWVRTGYEQWHILGPLMPGEKPLQQLAEVLEHSLVADAALRDTGKRYRSLQQDPNALALRLRDFKQDKKAFLLVVDQFEELFTFADKAEKLHFDQQLSTALKDKDCPLFVISTVRIDFLEGFEQLPCLSELYNQHCKRYLLKTIAQDGLREAIEQPARLAGLDVGAITTAIMNDAKDEPGALPLVENALRVLWEQRQGNRLSGELYISKGGIAGLLEEQADALLARLESDLPKGKADALELLLALTRINDEGRHTRRRLPLGEARLAAGGKKADPKRGQQVIDYLTGRPTPDGGNRKANGSLRLLVTVGDNEYDQSIDLIHETLIRAKGKDETSGKLVGYWKTLYDYIDKNRERGFYRDQLTRQAKEWQGKKGLGRWFNLASWSELRAYRKLRPEQGSVDECFLRRSRRVGWGQGVMLLLLLAFVGQSYLWTLDNSLPPSYMLTLQKFRLMDWGWLDEPLPEMVEKEIQPPAGEFRVGEYDKNFGEMANQQLKEQGGYGNNNFGYPNATAMIEQPFAIGKYEVTYEQYDYYVWQQQSTQKDLKYPNGEPSKNERGQRAVTYVSWNDANAYLQWLGTKMEGKYQYRLPTEAEWEYVARAGTDTPYWWGEEVGKGNANCDGCGSKWDNKYVAPVDSFKPNDFGLYNTAGNVWEWTCSEWKADFDGNEGRCVEPKNEAGARVLRGGSWNFGLEWLRSSARSRLYSAARYTNVGFRVLRSARTN